jgi:hypothetical protein
MHVTERINNQQTTLAGVCCGCGVGDPEPEGSHKLSRRLSTPMHFNFRFPDHTCYGVRHAVVASVAGVLLPAPTAQFRKANHAFVLTSSFILKTTFYPFLFEFSSFGAKTDHHPTFTKLKTAKYHQGCIHHTPVSPERDRIQFQPTQASITSALTQPTAPSLPQDSPFSAQFPPPTWPGLLEHTASMSRSTHRWDSNDRHGSDDGGYEYAGSSSHEWQRCQPWKPHHQSQPQQRNVPTTSSWQGAGNERQQRSWHRGAVTTLRQSGARPLRQRQPLRSAGASSASASALPWRTRNEFAEQQQKSPPPSRWHTRERGDHARQSAQEPFAQQRRAWSTRARTDTRERTATGRVRQERVQIHRRPRDWDDTRLSPPPTHTDEQLPVGKRLSHSTSATKQSRPWRQAAARDTSHASESKVTDFQRDCQHEQRSVAEFVQEREPGQNIIRRATFSGQSTFTSSTRPTVTNKRVAARPWASKTKARHRTNYMETLFSSPRSGNGVMVDATPTQATQDNDCDPSSDYENSDDIDNDGDRAVPDHINDRDSRTRCRLVLGKRKAVDGASRNDFDRRGLIGVAASAKAKVKRHANACMVGDCTSLVRSRGVCITHGGGKRCQYPEGCGKGAIGQTMFCTAHGGGKRCQYSDGCSKSAQGATSFCITHGGGKRCQYPEGCGKGAIGQTMFCTAHGGGRRCQYPDGCDNGARGATSFCTAHGGGKRCQYPEGCRKSAIGKTMFCVAHGGGKRCQYPEGCGKSAEGRTMFCVAHGGGKRCQYPDGCNKSAQGATSLCIAHGGGRRCIHSSGCNKLVLKGGMCKKHGAAAGLWA